jgi:hypothetical protein
MARMIDGTVTEAVRETAHPHAELAPDYDPLLLRVGDARFVLLGEASHGSHEFYRDRAWITKHLIETRHLWVGYFGASTGVAAALVAAAARPDAVDAIVSRGGGSIWPAGAGPRSGAYSADRRRARRPRHRAESRGIRAAAVRKAARHRPGGDAPVRGARGPGSGRQPGARVVRAPPHGRASPRGGHRAGIGAAPGPGGRHSLGPATSGAGAAPRSERPGWER